jgi:predicted small secreted protein
LDQINFMPFSVAPAATTYSGCDTSDLIFSGVNHTFTIAACNVGATRAGTGYDVNISGKKFQRGNNYGWKDDENVLMSSGRVDTSSYGPANPYYSDVFIIGFSNWTDPLNNDLRGGKTTDGSTTIPATLQDELNRQ